MICSISQKVRIFVSVWILNYCLFSLGSKISTFGITKPFLLLLKAFNVCKLTFGLKAFFKNKLFKLECSYWIQAFMMSVWFGICSLWYLHWNTLHLRLSCLVGTFQLNLYSYQEEKERNIRSKEISVEFSSKHVRTASTLNLCPLFKTTLQDYLFPFLCGSTERGFSSLKI